MSGRKGIEERYARAQRYVTPTKDPAFTASALVAAEGLLDTLRFLRDEQTPGTEAFQHAARAVVAQQQVIDHLEMVGRV